MRMIISYTDMETAKKRMRSSRFYFLTLMGICIASMVYCGIELDRHSAGVAICTSVLATMVIATELIIPFERYRRTELKERMIANGTYKEFLEMPNPVPEPVRKAQLLFQVVIGHMVMVLDFALCCYGGEIYDASPMLVYPVMVIGVISIPIGYAIIRYCQKEAYAPYDARLRSLMS